MATYIPNATQTTEPVESRTVGSAALEFRTLKTSVNARIEAVQGDLGAEIVNRIAGDANLQAQNNSQDVRLTAVENALLFIGEGIQPGTVYVQRLSGTGAQTVFTLNTVPHSVNVVDIYINGIYQNKDTFTVAGADVIFSKAPPAGTDNIEVQVTVTIALGETDASLVTYDGTTVADQLDAISAVSGSSLVGFQQAGSGAVVRTAQDKMREWVSVKDFGAVGDGVADDTAAIQAAVDAAIASRRSLFVPRTSQGALGMYRITAPITISAGIRIFGDGTNYCGFLCDGCSGIVISAGVNFVTIENLAIVQLARFSVGTPNNNYAITTEGTAGSLCAWHIYRNLFIDGFKWAFYVPFTWSSVFNGINAVYCFGGINSPGQSVNNAVSNCNFSGVSAAESVGVLIGDGITPTEGWMIQDSVLIYFAVGVHGHYANNSHVRGCIIDFCTQRGVFLQSSAVGPSTNWIIADNYIAFDGPDGATGIWLLNNFAPSVAQYRGTIVSNNQIIFYSGGALAYGIYQSGTAETNNVITGNRVSATTYACRIEYGTSTTVVNNKWKSGAFATDVLVEYAGNTGSVASSFALLRQSNGGRSLYFNSTPPTSGTFERGDIVWNFEPVAGGAPGWVCVAAGTPGTWKAMANLVA